MANGRIHKHLQHGELVTGTRTVGRPYLRHKDTCQRDMKMAGIDSNNWEIAAGDRGKWRSVVKTCTRREEDRRRTQLAERRDHWKQRSAKAAFTSQPCVSIYIMSAADAVEIVTPSDFMQSHRTDNPCWANHCLTRQTDATTMNVVVRYIRVPPVWAISSCYI